jgi:hypothetical protein
MLHRQVRTVYEMLWWINYLLYELLARWGEIIVSYPNRLFYILIIFSCLFFPRLSVFYVTSILCWAHKRRFELGY